ncbi:hypothetical protein Csa_023081, partial [Cucumis sativus]
PSNRPPQISSSFLFSSSSVRRRPSDEAGNCRSCPDPDLRSRHHLLLFSVHPNRRPPLSPFFSPRRSVSDSRTLSQSSLSPLKPNPVEPAFRSCVALPTLVVQIQAV